MANLKSVQLADPMAWLASLARPESLMAIAAFVLCIALAWLMAWGVRRLLSGYALTVLLGRRLIDGVLFPMLLLGLMFIARLLLTQDKPIALFDILLPVCTSLAVIRLGVKVLQVAFAGAAFVRALERTISWLAWAAVVLWVTGVLPMVLNELDQIHWKIGGVLMSVRTLVEGALSAGAVLIVVLWISSAIEARLLHSATGSDLSLRKVISNTVRALLMFVGLILGALVGGIWALVQLPTFALKGITVKGDVEHNNEVTLRANVVTKFTGNFFTADLVRVRSAFESVPWVRLASVQREFPNRLRVTLQEHKPVAYWGDDGEQRMVNSFGEVFEANTGDLEDDKMPRLSGPDSQSQQVLAMYLALEPAFKAMSLGVESLVLTDRGSWRAKLAHGAVIELGRGSVDDVMVRVKRVSQTLAQVTHKLGRKVSAIESADLRHDNGYALRVRGVSTQDVSNKR